MKGHVEGSEELGLARVDSRIKAKGGDPTGRLNWISRLDIDDEPCTVRKTSIICTIGPNTNSVEAMVELRRAGMNIVRMNFSHGSHEYHASVIANARASSVAPLPTGSKEGGVAHGGNNGLRPIALALDTKGPEIRSGNVKGGSLAIAKDHTFLLTIDKAAAEDGDCTRIYVDYEHICETVTLGSRIYIDDGNLQVVVTECLPGPLGGVRVRSLNAHILLNKKGVNLPYAQVCIPAVTDKDRADLAFGVAQGVDIVFASFIRKASDVAEIRACLGEAGRHIKVIAKIENHEGVKNFDEILAASDGIMVARGDLGIEIPPQKVFIAQKMMIARCNLAGKPAICATQMLESMKSNPRPTRAEASDVANAVLDGADCVMLSAETASGIYPIESVTTMASICAEAERTIAYLPLFEELRSMIGCSHSVTETVACSAVNAACEPYIHAIIVLSTTGETARQVAKFRPQVPILVVTREAQMARQIHLHRGCLSFLYPADLLQSASRATSPIHLSSVSDFDESTWQGCVDFRFNWAIGEAKRLGLLATGNHVVLIQGDRGGHGHTNAMRISRID